MHAVAGGTRPIIRDCNKRITLLSFAESNDRFANRGLGWESGALRTNFGNLQNVSIKNLIGLARDELNLGQFHIANQRVNSKY